MPDKTTGERIVEEWTKRWESPSYIPPSISADLCRRIDEALLTAMATAEGEVDRLRQALNNICTLRSWDSQGMQRLAREALAKKEV